MDKMFLFREY